MLSIFRCWKRYLTRLISKSRSMSSIEDLIRQEHDFAMAGEAAYGRYGAHAKYATLFLSNCIASMDRSRSVFGILLTGLKKHHTLSYLSFLRHHRVQAGMNLRQVLEFTALAAYSIYEPDQWKFLEQDNNGLVRDSEDAKKRAYIWLDENYEGPSKQIKILKALVNRTMAHASLASAFMTAHVETNQIQMPFFDGAREDLTKADLWIIASTAITVADLFFGVNEKPEVLRFMDNFHDHLNKLIAEDTALRAEMMASEKYKTIMDQFG